MNTTFHDPAVRDSAEKDLRASESKFRAILEFAPSAMVLADQQGHIALANAETERLFGYHRDEMVGQLVDILVPERFRGRHVRDRQDYTANPLSLAIIQNGSDFASSFFSSRFWVHETLGISWSRLIICKLRQTTSCGKIWDHIVFYAARS